jgi:hypothetical protein
MAKNEVYSWRVEADVKSALEDAARAEGMSMAQLLGRIVREWLRRRKELAVDEEAEQLRLREEAERYVGSLSLGRGPYTAARVREHVRRKRAPRDAAARPD